ncbi:MAG: arginine decarboxylase, pyruvoyl-dependent [Calditrichaeota bacterium]|nr:arginine decarboxylase, pyruvoyl-dependent [Calditrichota bacterium]MCB9391577.1 arginine decarboxylase, pyruvoyl-dependent [Calditrichota bacterium]
MIIQTPDKYFLVSGYSEGETELNAFDNSLLAAGVGNVNLVRMSSILPPAAKEINPIQLPYGALVPIAYAEEASSIPGETVSAGVALGVTDDPTLPGVIMEHHMHGSEEECRNIVIAKVQAAFQHRGWKLADMKVKVISGKVQRIGAAFAGVVLWT